MLDNKKVDKIIVSSVSLILVVIISIIGLSYSYFSTQIVGNDESSSVIITTLATKPVRTIEATGETYESMPIVRIGAEEFYDITNAVNYSSLDSSFKELIDYDASKSILLARYNLDKTTGIQTTSTTKSDYAVPFAGSSTTYGYWDPSSGIDSKYGTYTNVANNIYDTTYVTAPNYSVSFQNNAGNANYSVAYYVENYISTLGLETGQGRLLTYPEANAMTTNQRTNGQNYWLGSASYYCYVRIVYRGGDIDYVSNFDNASDFGVRPVVVVSTSDIQ